ncbi:ABC transporter permease [Candidatus Villigracilis saccharophilus]|uniref:ABC transporter permease n=1 Tax=Candidatus Villigracilis saccharophilus TaxID=3140684 RepID=UPI0031368CA5|nr:ABC transporter permease [Anaerolineales bacterium]
MLFSENFKIAIRALRANKLRSVLTMLGIVIGVATVVALLSIGKGATASITSDIQSSGTNLLTVSAGRSFGAPGGGASQQASHLYYSDYELLQRGLVNNVTVIVPSYQSSYIIKFGDESFSVSVTGVTANYQEVRSYDVANGRFITEGDNKSEAFVAVLGSQTAEDLFGSLSPIGKTVSVNGIKFKVVGVLESKGSTGFASSDDTVFIPLQTGYIKLFGSIATFNGKKTIDNIYVSVESTEMMDTVSAQIEYMIRRSHKLAASDDLDFSVQNQTDTLETLSSITDTLTVFLGAIAGISLLVGGIGIMNIMLVSVTERTKEIGLRKAVGATKNQIRTQFLIETMTLSVLGGVIGILLGIGIASIVTLTGLITAVITADSILLAFFFSLAIGVFFGLYPAFRAANLHPMVALRYE